MNRRGIYQLMAIVVFSCFYVVGKEYLITHDFSGIPSFFYPYFNIGIIMLLAACGFSFLAFTFVENESNRRANHKILFALLQVISFAIVIEFYVIKVFNFPMFVQILAALALILLVVFSSGAGERGQGSTTN